MMVSAIIVAAGKGVRMDDKERKQYLLLDGRPLISHTIAVFSECNMIDEIFLVVPEEDFAFCNDNILNRQNFQKKVSLVPGGAERQDSVYNGLLAIDNIDDSIVVIHDGVRPFIRSEQLLECITCAIDYDACILGIPAYDTLKRVDSSGFIENTIERNTIWLAQTPQAFKYKLIRDAHENARRAAITGTDDAMLVELLGIKVKVIRGSRCNVKITTKEDLLLAMSILNTIKLNGVGGRAV
ncbi:MAG: 2-C-methyl-D-erythritol 4-phosphate cytidylyltransferase [Proteobacteria bacterium]|nr:2-C-methyl-D-erythritol 4-phosphate cytidylyltransferase [Pseudomonadota bacterium]MBU4068065.1 2-C-methyl-D-erythritol 4-phosphate cytidylyltransferase [Pseudomonadota bacterium]MBU4100833.1 2-C-methyl-D-erythritol 4-phosphate cytidylyltransferase [Pseudomonadota bacterium]MBU4126377.1 2-C-methyl-D-erythritol 4-phosphate cytidylyltransferase [Pseudomonadota bacterium]